MEDGGSPYIGLIVLLPFLLAQAALHGFWAALGNQNESSLEKLSEEGNEKAGLLLRFLSQPDRSVHMVWFFITGLHLGAGYLITADFCGILRVAAFFLYGILLLIFGIYSPSRIAAKKAERWGLFLCRPMRLLSMLSFPFVFCMELAANLFIRLFGVDPKENLDDLTEEEIMSMVNEGHEQGVILASEAEMIHNIFAFDDKEAKDIMTHRKNIVALDGNMTFEEALFLMTESGNSRFPVYIEDIDNLIGVLHIKEALKNSTHPECLSRPIKEILDLVRKVDFIPETRNINTLFKEMQAEKSHMAVVVDEYGQTAGIVAMEDILEEIVGNILDEHDEDKEMMKKQPDGSFLIHGMAGFEDVKKALGLSDLEEEDEYETLNGFLISKIDKIPNEDDRMEIEACGYRFKVLAVENKIIQKVLARAMP